MVDGSGAELSEELFRAEGLQVVDDERPQMQDVVAWEAVALLHHHHLGRHSETLTPVPFGNNAWSFIFLYLMWFTDPPHDYLFYQIVRL